jgi:two-component sensor histidine kinase
LIITAQLLLLWFVAIYRSVAEKTADLERQRASELENARATLMRQRELEQELRAQNLALQETQQHLQTIYEATSEGVTLCRAIRSDDGTVIDYQVIEVNRAHKDLTGAMRDRMLSVPVSQIAPPVDPRWFESADNALKLGTMQQFDVYSRATRRWLNIRVSPISGDLFQQTFVDVSDRHLLDEQRQSLLKEMSHRVLNNFQMIASFLHLQSADAKPEVKQQLDIAKNRIQVIAKLHSLLAYSTTEDDVDVGSYLKELCGQLSQTIDRPAAIQLKCECPPSRLHPDAVVPLGLITSELVMNAIKYAFPAPRGGTITVRFHAEGPESWILEIEDDGIGLPLPPEGEPTLSSRGGLGMRLVQIFVRQLKGQLVTTSSPGVHHRLLFKA